MASKITLEDLSEHFAKWRAEKIYRCAPTPPHLISLAKQAATHYGVSKVIDHCGIDRKLLYSSPAPLKKIKSNPLKVDRVPDKTQHIPNFTKIQLATSMAQPVIEIDVPSGTRIKFFSLSEECQKFIASLIK